MEHIQAQMCYTGAKEKLRMNIFFLSQNKREQHVLKRRNVPAQDSTDSDEIEKLPNQSLKSIVENAASEEPNVQLSAVQAARYWTKINNCNFKNKCCILIAGYQVHLN